MAISRAEQIAGLKRAIPSVADRSSGESAAFDVGIRLSDQKILTLRTELPAAFPRIPPILRILDPGATHPWLDPSGRVAGLNELYNWDERTSDLGEIVQRALAEFCTRPPHVNPAVIAAGKAKETWAQTLPRQPSVRNNNSNGNGAATPKPVPLDNVPEIESLTVDELQALLDNEANLTKLYRSLSAVIDGEQVRESMKRENLDKATKNFSLGNDATSLQEQVMDLRRQVDEARQRLTVMLSQQKSLANPLDPYKLAESFEALARGTDRDSEELAAVMFDGNTIDESALAKFRALRVHYHLRKSMADRCRAQFRS